MTEGKGIGYKRWLTKHNLKVMAQTVKLLQEKGLTDEDALNQRITELETKYHDSLAVVKDLEGRMKFNKELRYHVAAYTSTKGIVQQFNTAKRPVAFEEQHRAELTAYRAAADYFKANDITKLPSPKSWKPSMRSWHPKSEVLRAVQRSERRTAQTENRKAECCVLFPGGRTDAAGEIKECANDQLENRPGVSVPDSPRLMMNLSSLKKTSSKRAS